MTSTVFFFFYHFKYNDLILFIFTIRVTRRVSYKKRELLAIREHMGSSPVFIRVFLARLFSFLCRVCLRLVLN